MYKNQLFFTETFDVCINIIEEFKYESIIYTLYTQIEFLIHNSLKIMYQNLLLEII